MRRKRQATKLYNKTKLDLKAYGICTCLLCASRVFRILNRTYGFQPSQFIFNVSIPIPWHTWHGPDHLSGQKFKARLFYESCYCTRPNNKYICNRSTLSLTTLFGRPKLWAALCLGGPYLGAKWPKNAQKPCKRGSVLEGEFVYVEVLEWRVKYLIGPFLGGPNWVRPFLWAALIVGARGPSAQIRAAQIRANKVLVLEYVPGQSLCQNGHINLPLHVA